METKNNRGTDTHAALRVRSLALGVSGVLAVFSVACSGDDGGGDGDTAGGTATQTSGASGDTANDDDRTDGPGPDDGGATPDSATDNPTTDANDSTDDGGSSGDDDPGTDSTGEAPVLDDFSFFLTSLDGIRELSGNEDGFGGNLTYDGQIGIDGADHICATLAEMSMPGSSVKQWRAFLSTMGEDAIDRVGAGPWYDRNGRLLADDIDGLLGVRPGGDPMLADNLANEWGVPNSAPDGKELDNHDTMTASGTDGRLRLEGGGGGGGGGGSFGTCGDWTSAAPGQDPPAIGHSWPAQSGQNWLFVGRHATGCEPYVQLRGNGGCGGELGVGCGGGYGGFYCMALTP